MPLFQLQKSVPAKFSFVESHKCTQGRKAIQMQLCAMSKVIPAKIEPSCPQYSMSLKRSRSFATNVLKVLQNSTILLVICEFTKKKSHTSATMETARNPSDNGTTFTGIRLRIPEHKRRHQTGEKPFVCDHDICKERFVPLK